MKRNYQNTQLKSLQLFCWFLKHKFYWLLDYLIPDPLYVSIKYAKRLKKRLILTAPSTFNEKIQWIKLYNKCEKYTICADKLQVRNFVMEKIGEKVLNELYATYMSVDEIDLSKLPESFVLKATHGSGLNHLCKDKNSTDWNFVFKMFRYYLKTNYYFHSKEWAYKNIVPKIICEKYLDENGHPPLDYKFFCFNGEPRFVQVDIDRFGRHARNIYDLNWNLLDLDYEYPRSSKIIKRPKHFEKMIQYASKLSEPFAFVRADFYSFDNLIIFGEMTFYPAGGSGLFNPEYYDKIFGDFLELPTCA